MQKNNISTPLSHVLISWDLKIVIKNGVSAQSERPMAINVLTHRF